LLVILDNIPSMFIEGDNVCILSKIIPLRSSA
jgi:hypothetical protein